MPERLGSCRINTPRDLLLWDGLVVRMDGITMDYQEPDGLTFFHATLQNDLQLDPINLN